MKQFYFSLFFFGLTLFISAQNNPSNTSDDDIQILNPTAEKYGITARPIATSTSPNGTSTEVGVTNGSLSISLTGNANYSIPIMVPPGINGVEPSVSINYNSQKGLSGTAAIGWDISGISSITRIPATTFHDGIIDPVDFDNLDRFALDGQRLILKPGSSVTYGGNLAEYQTEYFSNLKITSYGVHPSGANYGPAYFVVEYPNGNKAYYGNSTDSRSVMDWSITYIDNAQANRISYTYTAASNSLYIASIKYGGLTNTTPINEIKFVYGTRTTVEDSYIGGVNIKRDKNLTEINVIGNGSGFRNYNFGYSVTDKITSVIEKNGDKTKSYNPTSFVYDYNVTDVISYQNRNNTLDMGNILSTNAKTVSGDFDGDGNMDFILYPTNGTYAKSKYWLYTDTTPNTPFSFGMENNVGTFDEIFPVNYIDAGNKLSSTQGWTVVNGGLFTTYYLSSTASIPINDQKVFSFPRFILDYYYQCGGTNPNANQNIQPRGPVIPPTEPVAMHYESNIPRTYVSGDFNGDGITDVVAIEKSFTYPYRYLCTTITSTYAGGKAFFINLDKSVTTNFANQAGYLSTTNVSDIRVADFDGDGKSDIYVFDSGSLKIYSLDNTNYFVLLFQTTDTNITLDKPILMGDYNGDGKTDIIIPKAFGSTVWCKYISTGVSLLKEEKSFVTFTANDSYNTYNYLAIDFNNDSKTDIICERSNRNTANTLGSITLTSYKNDNGFFTTTASAQVNTGDKAEINIYALPVYLPANYRSFTNGYYKNSSTLEVAFLNQNKVHFFTSQLNNIRDNLLTNIITGNGVEQAITYIPLNSSYTNMSASIYTPSISTATYPYFDIRTNSNLYVVSKIEQQSKDNYKKKLFGYYGAVSNFEGLGFIGFRSVTQTNWHDDTTRKFTDIYKNDVNLRGANIETASVPYLTYPYPGALPSDFTTKSVTTYNILPEVPLQSNKVFRLKTSNVKQFNSLNDTSSEVKDIVYDTNDNVKSSTTTTSNGSSVVQTVKTDIEYQDPITSPLYILGRPLNKTVSITGGGPTMTNKEVYSYNAQQLLSNTDKSATGTATISESNDYDSYGNILKKTITAPLPLLPRVTKYEYDTTKRFINKITDNDDLVTSFEYDLNGLLKKETNPYNLSKSYTYDSWFKNTIITDNQLNNTITINYARSAEKTIITTTSTASGLDSSVSEETFDDLGRKIKSGIKDLNGNFSYISYLYDLYDRNYKVSEPYIGASPSQWNEVKFDDYGRSIQNNQFNGRTTSASYPLASLKTIFTDGAKTKTTTKNAAGNTILTNEPSGGDINYSYFSNGNLRKTTYNNVDITLEQDGWGNKTVLTDPSAGTYRYSYNDLGELKTETIDGTGVTTTFTRDKSGKPLTKTIVGSGSNSETTYTYDGYLPLTIRYVDNNEPVASKTTLTTITYDASKRISSIVEDKTGTSTFTRTFTYDNLDRIVTEIKTAKVGSTSSSIKTKNVYKNGVLHQIVDDATSKVLWQTNTLNPKGQVLESQTGSGIKMTNTYDSDGYLSTVKHDKISTSANILTFSTSFDKNTDYLKNRTNSLFGNYYESFLYDELGRLKEFTNKLGQQETQTYDISGKITGNNLGTYSYDTTKPYQNTSIALTPEATGYYANREGIFNDSMEDKSGWGIERHPSTIFFSYDVTKIPHAYGKTTLKLSNTTTTEQYVYSDKMVVIDNAAPTQYTYSAWVYSDSPQAQIFLEMKDASGALSYDDVVSNTTGQWTQIIKTFLVPANIKKIRIRLDNNGLGNMWYDDVEIRKTSNPASSLRQLNTTYNAFKSPIQIEETNVDKISFSYNDNNQRSIMYYGSLDNDKLARPFYKHYSEDGSMEVKENRLTNKFEFITYIGGDGYTAPIALKSDGNTQNYLYLHRDYQGTIIAISNEAGAVIEKRLFDAWGSIIKVQDGAGNSLAGLTVLDRGYTGHEHLQSVGLINMNARLYDPLLHRFLQADNIIQDPTNTQNYNQYGYVFNNPLLFTDPSGNYGEGGGGGSIGVGPGNQTGTSVDVEQLGKDLGIDKWLRKNINGDKWSKWEKSTISFNNFFGGGNKNNNPAPSQNMSSYINLTDYFSYTSTHQAGKNGTWNSTLGDQFKLKTYVAQSFRSGGQKMFDVSDTFFNRKYESRSYQFNLGRYNLNYRPRDKRLRLMWPSDKYSSQGTSFGLDGIGYHYNIRGKNGMSAGFDAAFRPGGHTLLIITKFVLAIFQPETIPFLAEEQTVEEMIVIPSFAF